jgi:chromate reductase
MKALALSGSLRKESYNTKALKIAIKILKENDIEVDFVEAAKMNLELFNQDDEDKGYSKEVKDLYKRLDECELLVIASPEYNHSVSCVLKNFIDWMSRDGNHLSGKTAVIFGASTGGFGTLKSQLHLREILSQLNVLVYPQPRLFISFAQDAFDKNSNFKNKDNHVRMEKLILNTINSIKE